MRFEISFNENIYREQSKKYFAFIWKDFQSKNKKRLYIIIPYFLLGVSIVYAKSNLGYLFIVISLFNLYQYYKLYQHHKTNKEKYFNIVEKNILEYSSNDKLSINEFRNDNFYYFDFKMELTINWNLFKKFTVIENDLFLELNDGVFATFFINKEEVGEVEFNKIILFLENKIVKD